MVEKHRGKGVGSRLVRELLARHAALDRRASDICLLTLSTTAAWYEQFGFAVVEDPKQVPEPLAFEVAAGTLITSAIGADLVVMRGREAP